MSLSQKSNWNVPAYSDEAFVVLIRPVSLSIVINICLSVSCFFLSQQGYKVKSLLLETYSFLKLITFIYYKTGEGRGLSSQLN